MIKHDDITQDVKNKAQELGEDAKEAIQIEAERKAADLRDRAAHKVDNAANAAEAAAAEFDYDSIQARAAHQVADQVQQLSERLRSTDLNSVTRDVSAFARKNPALFIGGAALLGFAATRFLKARDPNSRQHSGENSDPWGAGPTANTTSRGYDVPS